MTMYSSRMGATGEYVSVLCPHSEGQAPAAPIGAAAPAPERTNAEWRILEFLPEPVLVVRGHTIVAVNDATLAAFGYGSKDELEGQPAAMLMQQADALEHEAAVEQHETAGDAPAIERAPRVVNGVRRDGKALSFSLAVSPRATPGEYHAVFYSRAQAEAREEAEMKRSDMSRALKMLSEPVIMMKDRIIVSVNEATVTLFGYDDKSELEGKPVTILMPPTQATAHDGYVDKYETTGERKVIGKPRVVTGQRKDGQSISLTLSVSPCGVRGEYIGILYSRTEVVARELAEAQRSDMFRALETLSEPVIMMKDRVIVSVNAATVTLFGYADKGELEGKPVTILMPPTQATAHDGYVDKYETTGERKVIGKPRVVTGQRKDGHSISLTLSVSPCGVRGEYIGILYSRTEVVARELAEAQRSDMFRALEALSKPVIMMHGRTIVSVNQATLSAFGYANKDELVGKPVTILMPPAEAAAHDGYVDRYEKTGERRVIGKPRVVVGRHKDGSAVSLTLAVSPCAAPGEYIGILYRRSDVEARFRAEAAEARAHVEAQLQAKVNELLESEVARLQLLIRVGSDGSAEPMAVAREPSLITAWTGEWRKFEAAESWQVPSASFSCCATVFDKKGRMQSCHWLHRGNILGDKAVLTPGSHAFVKVLTEPFLRVSPNSHKFGKASGHPQLANEQPVLYAGEVELDQHSAIVRWNNLSGTYKAEDSMCFQTGLALDRFWAVHPASTYSPAMSARTDKAGEDAPSRDPLDADVSRANESSSDEEEDLRYVRVSPTVVLRRVLSLSDEALEGVRSDWDARIQLLCEQDQMARRCFRLVQTSLNERCQAVSQYGYLTLVRNTNPQMHRQQEPGSCS